MAEDVTRLPALSTPERPEQASPPPPPPLAPHRARFLFVYGGLGAVLAAAIAGVVVFAGDAINPGPKWSAWKPTGGGQGAAKQIADHVGKSYRLANGEQLVDVIAKAPSVSPTTGTIPIHYVAVRGKHGAGDQAYVVSPSNSIMYSLCGLGQLCDISSGKPSVARGTLVRREILELALYTFKYVGGINSVIAFMPPKAGTRPKYIVYLQKSELMPQLSSPLENTLGRQVPLPSAIPAREVRTIDAATESRVYTFSLSQAPQGDLVLVLAPV